MKQGYLYEKTEAELDNDIRTGAKVVIGVDANNVLDTITTYEIMNENNANKVIAQIKQDLMVIVGKITINKKE